jgi:hypothetical protein
LIKVAAIMTILIYSDTLEQHEKHVKTVFQRLRECNLYIKAEKCKFHVIETQFLGHIIKPGSIQPSPSKVNAILDWHSPSTVNALCTFLGLAKYYHRFIPKYSKISKPLHQLTEKDRQWLWDETCETAFTTIKTMLSSSPVLIHFDPAKKIHIEVDTLKFAIGAVLSQTGDDGQLHPVKFYSHSLIAAEMNYDTSDKEILAIVAALRHWYHHLAFTKYPIQIYSDHQNLQYFMTPRAWNPHQNRWLNELLEFDFKISWVPGKEMTKADALSRQPALATVGQQEGLPLRPLLQPNQYDPLPEAPDLQICSFCSLFTEGPTEENDDDISADEL